MFNLNAEFNIQRSFFFQSIEEQLDPNNRYVVLSKKIDWETLVKEVSSHYSPIGRPTLPLRLMLGLNIIKFIENLSDERVIQMYMENPYVQFFCGSIEYSSDVPCSNAMLSIFRNKIGEEGCSLILRESTCIHGEKALEDDVIVDTTAQIKDITYPTDIKLLIKVAIKCRKIAKKYSIHLKNTYKDQLKELIKTIRFEKSSKKQKEIRKAKRRIRTIAGRLVRELKRKLLPEQLSDNEKDIQIFEKVLEQSSPNKKDYYHIAQETYDLICDAIEMLQNICDECEIKIVKKTIDKMDTLHEQYKNSHGTGKRKSVQESIKGLKSVCNSLIKKIERHLPQDEQMQAHIQNELTKIAEMLSPTKDSRIYSIHEPEVGCITKGKAGVAHEYGSKAAICVTKTSGIIVGVGNFEGNPHDSNTMQPTIDNVQETTNHMPVNCYADRGFKGSQKKAQDVNVCLPSTPTDDMSKEEQDEARFNFGRRSSIEPIIGHVKSDHRLQKTYLAGRRGDQINLILSCAAFNFKKWINHQVSNE